MQEKLQAADHWRKIAEHFAGQLAADLNGKLNGRALYVPTPGGEQAFVEGFRELLITALVQQGLPVSSEARNALVVDVHYSIYRFRPDRAENTYFYGEATALTTGLWAIGGVMAADISSVGGVTAGVKLLSAIAGLEGFSWLANERMGKGQYATGPVPRSEILLTASIADNSRIISRRSNIYYAVDADQDLYWKRTAQAQSISVFGDCADGSKACVR